MGSIPSNFFDILILIIVAVGLIWAVRQIRHDFRLGPRFAEPPRLPVQAPNPKDTKGTKAK